jgi:GT2 family glycosyltransferase
MLKRDNMIKPLNTTVATLVEAGRLSAEARQIMTKKAIRMGAEYILYMDDDTLAPDQGLYKLHNFMERHPEIGAISGVVTTREDPPEPVVYRAHGEGAWWDFPKGPGAIPQPVFATGAAFLLARLSAVQDVIDKMQEKNGGEEVPIWADERCLPGENEELGATTQIIFGHDVRFCRLLNMHGHPVYVHGDVQCGHLDAESNTVYEMPDKRMPIPEPETDRQPSVDVVVVGYNQPEMEQDTVKAVIAHTDYPNYSIVYRRNEPGKSLAKCWNEIIRASKADWICLLNPDTVPAKLWLEKLMEAAGPDVGAVVPSSNIVHLSQIDTPLDRFEQDWEKINQFSLSLPYEREELETASGMCVAFPKSVWEEAGGFDEEFQLYGEDTEFFHRIHANLGKKIVWQKYAYVHHYKAQCVEKAIEEEGLDVEALKERAQQLCIEKMRETVQNEPPQQPDQFAQFRGYTSIVVTGPQRSGTRIHAKILAEELGYRYVDEEEFDYRNFSKCLAKMTDKTVIQAPALASMAHMFPEDALIVYMRRPIDDIVASQNRIKWSPQSEAAERKMCPIEDQDQPVAALKYQYWDEVQAPQCEYYINLPYGAFKEHPLWASPEKRWDFAWNQTS